MPQSTFTTALRYSRNAVRVERVASCTPSERQMVLTVTEGQLLRNREKAELLLPPYTSDAMLHCNGGGGDGEAQNLRGNGARPAAEIC